MARHALLCILAAALLLGAGCSDGGSGPDDGGAGDADMSTDADASDDARPDDAGPRCLQALPVDMLWVIDNSHSMEEEQRNLAANFPALVEALTAPIDIDGDGDEDFPPVEDLRVGIVTTDMGTGASSTIGCDESGDDGALVDAARGIDPDCEGMTVGPPPWMVYNLGDDVEAFSQRFACLAQLGTEGCGYEQHLDAVAAALTTHAGPGGANEGFLRETSLVVIVIVTDEDDCSATGDALFASTAAADGEFGLPGTRCAFNPDQLSPISSFIAALDPLRLDRAGGFAVAVIAGVPPELVSDPQAVDYDALLADERMQYRISETNPNQIEPACTVTSIGSAAPARRLVEFVRDFAPGDRGLVQSICSANMRPAMEAIADMVARRLCDRVH